ncbi:MAG: hypothetical protein PHN84_14765 [Desulfuromonadaceae bacterium]|nr:hypothetical protein [Desulfuromonadaceae bacterium]
MNILLLSNSAPNYYNYFNALCRLFKADGSKIFVAADCEYSVVENDLKSLNSPIHIFSDFFSTHEYDAAILERYKHYNLNNALLSDFERAQVYKIGKIKSSDYYERLKCALLDFFELIITKNNISHILYENISNTFAYYAYIVSQEKGAKYCGLMMSRLPGRFCILSAPQAEHIDITHTISRIESGDIVVDESIKKIANEYLDNIETFVPDYMRFNNLENVSIISKYAKIEKFKKIITSFKYLNKDHTFSFQLGNPFLMSWSMFKRTVARKFKTIKVKKKYSEPDLQATFILYPLHFHPESSTSVLSGTYLDEYEVIRNIAFNLPQGVQLYVKDHKSAWGYPRLDFYKKIIRLPNVRLLAPTAPTKKLIKACQAVITLTSTVGYEALLMGKRVFLYGSVFYQQHPGVVRVENPSKLFDLFMCHLNRPCGWDRKFNKRFVSAYYLCTYAGVLNLMSDAKAAERLASDTYPQVKNFIMTK